MANDNQLGDGPVDPRIRESLEAVATAIDTVFNGKDSLTGKIDRKTGFVLMVFPYNDDTGRCNYISNGADRKDVVKMFKAQIERFEGEGRFEE